MSGWREQLAQELPLLGHRNWIVVADSAYPAQSRPGIRTLVAGGDHIEMVRAVLDALARTRHVRPSIFVDAELQHVPEEHAPGIGLFREQLNALLADRSVSTLPHEEIIARLDGAGALFHVLILKTDLTIPYTSVFLQLECGYWTAEAEAALRDRMKTVKGKRQRGAVRRKRAR
jgi:hypothetical protein